MALRRCAWGESFVVEAGAGFSWLRSSLSQSSASPVDSPAAAFEGVRQGVVEVFAPADIEGQPVVAFKFAGQAALDKTGFARTGSAVYQEEIRLEDHLVEAVDFFLAPEEDVAIFAGVGIEEFEGVFFVHELGLNRWFLLICVSYFLCEAHVKR
jgi:hypothetical protein